MAGVIAAGILALNAIKGGAISTAAGRPRVSPEVPVTPSDLRTKPANNSPQLAAHPTRKDFLVLAHRLDGPDFSCALQLSDDGGRTWATAQPVPKLPAGADKCYGPEVAFAPDGTLFYLFVGLKNEGNLPVGAYLATSRDYGLTFSRPQQILEGLNFAVRMAIDPMVKPGGRIHLVWIKAGSEPGLGSFGPPPNPVMAAYSDNGGVRFSKPVQVSEGSRQRVVAPALALGLGGSVHVLFYDLLNDVRDYQGLAGPAWEGNWELVSTASSDGGKSFSSNRTVDADIVPPERVMLIFTMAPASIAVDGKGTLFAAWPDARNGDWDVLMRRSPDGGRNWSRPLRLNDDPLHNGRHQYMPRLSAAPDGRIDAIFYDRRGNVENRGNDVYYTFSRDGGKQFLPNQRLTNAPFDSRIGPRYAGPAAQGLFEFGSRIALHSESHGAVAAWTDTRNTVRGPPSQDIFAAQLDLADSKRLPGWWSVMFALVVAAAGLSILNNRRKVSL